MTTLNDQFYGTTEDFEQCYDGYPDDYYDWKREQVEYHPQESLEAITNDQFLSAIHGTNFDVSVPLVCCKEGDPDKGGWYARRWPCDTSDSSKNWYFQCGHYKPDPQGGYRAKKEYAHQINAIVVDDIGTKVPAERFLECTPSWVIETSPNNSQYGFIFSEPVTDLDAVESLKADLIANGLCDPGASGVSARWSRLPQAINGRPKYGSPSPRCRLTQWNPSLKYTIRKLYEKLDLKASETDKDILFSGAKISEVLNDEIAENKGGVLNRIVNAGLYKKNLGGGKHDITCPWFQQHTDAIDNGSAYFEPSAMFPSGGFKCHHSHGELLHISDLLKFLGVEGHDNEKDLWSPPQSIPPTLRAVDALDPDLLPGSIKAAVIDIADRLQCPPDYIVVAMLSAAGTVIGNRVGIFPYANDESWEVYPALWGGIVGDPGSKKTPSLQAAHHPIAHLESLANQKYAQDMQSYSSALSQYEDDLTNWRKSKSKGLKPLPPTEPKRERYVVHDTTYQALGIILSHNPRGVMAVADELSGLLQSLDTAGQEAARGFYLSGWSGNGRYSFDRIGREAVTLDRYCLTVFGGFQPDRVKSYVKQTQRGNSKNDGLLQRFQLLVWPDPVDNPIFVDRQPDQSALSEYHKAVISLPSRINGGINGAKYLPNGSQLLHFSSDAQLVFNAWFVTNEASLTPGKLDPARLSHFAKYRSLVPALALLFHLLDDCDGNVSTETLAKAISYVKHLRSHANRIYASVSGGDLDTVRLLAQRLIEGALGEQFSCRSLILKGWSGLATKEQAQGALDVLVESGWLREMEVKTGGRPSFQYLINPKVSADLL